MLLCCFIRGTFSQSQEDKQSDVSTGIGFDLPTLVTAGALTALLLLLSMGLFAADVYLTSRLDGALLDMYGPEAYDEITSKYLADGSEEDSAVGLTATTREAYYRDVKVARAPHHHPRYVPLRGSSTAEQQRYIVRHQRGQVTPEVFHWT